MHFSNNPKIQQELKEFSDKIDTVSNEQVRDELDRKFRQLCREIKELESSHMMLTTQKLLPSSISDTRQKITDLRKSIHKTLNDWAETQSH